MLIGYARVSTDGQDLTAQRDALRAHGGADLRRPRPNVQPILTRPINWALIREQYDEMVKYATDLRLGTAETEAMLSRGTTCTTLNIGR